MNPRTIGPVPTPPQTKGTAPWGCLPDYEVAPQKCECGRWEALTQGDSRCRRCRQTQEAR